MPAHATLPVRRPGAPVGARAPREALVPRRPRLDRRAGPGLHPLRRPHLVRGGPGRRRPRPGSRAGRGHGPAQPHRPARRGPVPGAILVSHLHWDHVWGLPFFAGGDREGSEVEVYVPAQGGLTGEELVAGAMSPPNFPIGPDGLRGQWAFHAVEPGERQVGGFRVTAAQVHHKGGRTFGYRVQDGSAAIAYLPDHRLLGGRLGGGPADGPGGGPAGAQRPVRRARARGGRRLRALHRAGRDQLRRRPRGRRPRPHPPRAEPDRRRARRHAGRP